MRITVPDYGVGNLHSVKKALEMHGASVVTVTEMSKLADAECIVFPGVGAFDKTMERLLPHREGICRRLDAGVPALGICIGMQINFDSSEEGKSKGLGFISGKVVKLETEMTPHMGWNTVETEDRLMDGIKSRCFYFAHSYYGRPRISGDAAGMTEYCGQNFPSMFRKKNFYGTQFHPEKSGESGLKFISNFIEFAEEHI